MIEPDAPEYIQDILRTPLHNDTLNEKLMHNNKVFHFFKENGIVNNCNFLLRSTDSGEKSASKGKIDDLKNLSNISNIRLEKLRKSIKVKNVLLRADRSRKLLT